MAARRIRPGSQVETYFRSSAAISLLMDVVEALCMSRDDDNVYLQRFAMEASAFWSTRVVRLLATNYFYVGGMTVEGGVLYDSVK